MKFITNLKADLEIAIPEKLGDIITDLNQISLKNNEAFVTESGISDKVSDIFFEEGVEITNDYIAWDEYYRKNSSKERQIVWKCEKVDLSKKIEDKSNMDEEDIEESCSEIALEEDYLFNKSIYGYKAIQAYYPMEGDE